MGAGRGPVFQEDVINFFSERGYGDSAAWRAARVRKSLTGVGLMAEDIVISARRMRWRCELNERHVKVWPAD